jgi:hypothetical protein
MGGCQLSGDSGWVESGSLAVLRYGARLWTVAQNFFLDGSGTIGNARVRREAEECRDAEVRRRNFPIYTRERMETGRLPIISL